MFNEFESNVTRQSNAPHTFRFTLRTGYAHFLANNWIVSPFVFVERNPDLGLKLRSAAVLAAGRYLQRSNSSDALVTVFPELNHWGRVRANTNAKIKRELFRSFFASVTVYDTFDNQPPIQNVSHNDIGVNLSIG